MARGKKIDWEKVRESRRDDGRPWFVCALQPPPMGRDMLVIWPDGRWTSASLQDGKWLHFDHLDQKGAPVGWKPLPSQGMVAGFVASPLPDPLLYGLQIRTS